MNSETMNAASKNNEVATPGIPVSESELKEIQTQRFTDTLNEILTGYHNPKVWFSENLVQRARVNIQGPLNNAQLNHLCYFADSWNQDMSLSRSGAGLKIQFTLKNN